MTAERERVVSTLGGARYARLFAALRARVEQVGLENTKSVTLKDLTDDERSALAGLLGTKTTPRASVRVRIDELDAALRSSALATSLEACLAALYGPLENRRAKRVAKRARRADAYARAIEHAALAKHPELSAWLDDVKGRGLVARAARGFDGDEGAVLDLALDVLARLPAGGVLLPVIAAERTGDAHAFDAGTLMSAILLRGVARLLGADPPSSADERRRLWSRAGVECDSLSPSVLVVGLRPSSRDRVSRNLNEAADAGDPVRLTLYDVERHALRFAPAAVLVVENPAVVAAAAERFASRAPPLVCVEGVPTTAAWRLLASLSSSGSTLAFHTDFDWGGLRIGNALVERVGAAPFAMGAADYARAAGACRERAALAGEPVAASWDGELAATMQRAAAAIYEEQVLDELLGHLERAGLARAASREDGLRETTRTR